LPICLPQVGCAPLLKIAATKKTDVRKSRRWWGHRRLSREDQLRRPGRDSDEPGHPLPIHFHQDRLTGLLRFLELLDRRLRAVDRLLANLLQDVARLEADVVGR